MLYTGIDIIEIARIQRIADRWGQRFLDRVFTTAELSDCGFVGAERRNYASLAARWAAKEAASKALGVGVRGLGAGSAASGVALIDLEVVREPSGRPTLRLWRTAEQAAQARGITALALSLSHSRDYAVANVFGIGMPFP